MKGDFLRKKKRSGHPCTDNKTSVSVGWDDWRVLLPREVETGLGRGSCGFSTGVKQSAVVGVYFGSGCGWLGSEGPGKERS